VNSQLSGYIVWFTRLACFCRSRSCHRLTTRRCGRWPLLIPVDHGLVRFKENPCICLPSSRKKSCLSMNKYCIGRWGLRITQSDPRGTRVNLILLVRIWTFNWHQRINVFTELYSAQLTAFELCKSWLNSLDHCFLFSSITGSALSAQRSGPIR
jgi:hypothetical protein